MNDPIRLRAGNKEGMPLLSDREPAYVRDEEALYIGTPRGNVQVAAAGTAGRVTALETLTAAQKETLAAHSGTLSAHGERLTAQEEALDTHSELLESMEGLQQLHSDRLSACGELLDAHTAALAACEKAVGQLHAEKLSAVPAAAQAALPADADLPSVTAACNGLIAALKAAGIMHQEG